MSPVDNDNPVTYGWRILADGVMVEVVNGSRPGPNGSVIEMTTTVIARAGLVIRKELAADFVKRFDADEPYARSIAERVAIQKITVKVPEYDGEGNFLSEVEEERDQITPIGKPEAASSADGSGITSEELETAQREALEADQKATKAAKDLETAEAAKGVLENRIQLLEDQLKKANEPKPFDYSKLSPEALAAEAEKRKLEVTGTGAGDPKAVLKGDLVKALTEADAK